MADHAVVPRPAGGSDQEPPGAPAVTRAAPPSSSRRWLLRLVLVVATTVVTLTVFRLVDSPVADVTRPVDDDGLTGVVLPTPYELRDATLTDTTGAGFPLRDRLQAPVTLLFFGYTNCDDICSTVMSNIASAKARLTDDEAADVDTWFVTTDPARDDPATLRGYLDRFDPRFEGFTGSLSRIVSTAEQVHVPVVQGPRLPSGGYDITHGTPILGVRPDGSVPILWTEGTSAAKLADDITTILADGIPAVGKDG